MLFRINTWSVGVPEGVARLAAHVLVARLVAHPGPLDGDVQAPQSGVQQPLVVPVDTRVGRLGSHSTVYALPVLTPLQQSINESIITLVANQSYLA